MERTPGMCAGATVTEPQGAGRALRRHNDAPATSRCTSIGVARHDAPRPEPPDRSRAAGPRDAVAGLSTFTMGESLAESSHGDPGGGFTMRPIVRVVVSMALLVGCGEGFNFPPSRLDDDPVLLWVGATPDPPDCPMGFLDYWDGWADVSANVRNECGPCSCGPTACVLPSKLRAHEASRCASEGTPVRLDITNNQRGECITTSPAIPDNEIASVALDPPTFIPRCEPLEQPTPPPLQGTFARACPWAPGARVDFAWLTCITPEPNGSCHLNFPVRFEFQEKIRDGRTCTPCACGEPVGGKCVADVLLFRDTECSDMIFSINGVEPQDRLCVDTPSDSPLAAARVVLAQDIPGKCPPRSEVSFLEGTIESGDTRVFCCGNHLIINGNLHR